MRCEAVTKFDSGTRKPHRCWQCSYPDKTMVPWEKRSRSLCRMHRNMVMAGKRITFSRSKVGADGGRNQWA